LQAKLFDHALHAANADLPSALRELLRDHFGRRLGIEEPVPDRLAHHLGGSTIMRLGTALAGAQGPGAQFGEGGPQLKVALSAEAKLARGPRRPQPLALAFDEHGELAGDLIVLGHAQPAAGSDQGMLLELESRHDILLDKRAGALDRNAAALDSETKRNEQLSLINYGGICRRDHLPLPTRRRRQLRRFATHRHI
jgi:hypothetical protein